MARVIAFTSATKGVGKTHLVVNLAHHLSHLGYGTCLVNADSNTATVHDLLGIRPRYTLKDVTQNLIRLDKVILKGPNGLDFFPGYPGIESLGMLEPTVRDRLLRSFLELNRYDFFLLDTFPGLSRNVVAFCKASSEVILVMTAAPDSLTKAYLMLKTLTANRFEGSVMVLINMSKDVKVARRAYVKFKEAVGRYLPITVMPLGTVFEDLQVQEAERKKIPFVSLYPNADASKCIFNIARHLFTKKGQDLAVSAFWVRFLESLKHPLQITGLPSVNLRQNASGGGERKSALPEASFDEPSMTVSSLESEGSEGNLYDKAVHGTLQSLLDNIAAVTQDLKEVKRAVCSIRKEDVESKTIPEKPQPREPDKIPLDFEAFLKLRKMRKQ